MFSIFCYESKMGLWDLQTTAFCFYLHFTHLLNFFFWNCTLSHSRCALTCKYRISVVFLASHLSSGEAVKEQSVLEILLLYPFLSSADQNCTHLTNQICVLQCMHTVNASIPCPNVRITYRSRWQVFKYMPVSAAI